LLLDGRSNEAPNDVAQRRAILEKYGSTKISELSAAHRAEGGQEEPVLDASSLSRDHKI